MLFKSEFEGENIVKCQKQGANMIVSYAKTKLAELEEDLLLFTEMGISDGRKVSGQINAVRSYLNDIKSFLLGHPFENQAEEIHFFKYIKPGFTALRIFTTGLFVIENNKPAASAEEIHQYYQQELRLIRKFFEHHRFLYHYFQLDHHELDAIYFVRGQRPENLLLLEGPDPDPEFSTTCDYLFGKFIAYERLQTYLYQKIHPSDDTANTRRMLTWTGDKVNLLELAYAIFDTSQLNNGDVDLIDIISWLESSLHISLNRHYRMFSELKNRKSVSPTRYLDHAAAMVREHLRQGDEFRPKPPAPVSGSKSASKK